MTRRRRPNRNMGEAISMEDALSMLIVIFVLFVVFLVPMVSLEKIKLEKAARDPVWEQVKTSLALSENPDGEKDKYTDPLGLEFCLQSRTSEPEPGIIVVEALGADSSLSILEHTLHNNSFISLFVQKGRGAIITRSGLLVWSPEERAWRIASKSTSYGYNDLSKKYRTRYLEWFHSGKTARLTGERR